MVILKRNYASRGIIVDNARPDPEEHVTIDLSVGDRYQVAGKPEWYELRRSYPLRPGNCILVKTRERITVPADVFGMLFSKGSLSAIGLIVSNTKIDPLFGDQLNIPIFNAGRKTLRIQSGMPFCCISFHTLEQTIPVAVFRRAITQQVPKRRIIDFIADQPAGIISGVIGAVVAISVAILTNAVFRSAKTPVSVSPTATPILMSTPTPTTRSEVTPQPIESAAPQSEGSQSQVSPAAGLSPTPMK